MAVGGGWRFAAQVLFVGLVRGAGLAVVAGLLFLGVARGAGSPSAGGGHLQGRAWDIGEASSECWRPKRAEVEFQRRMNLERTGVVARNLRLDPELSFVARQHTKAMVADQTLQHSTERWLRRRVTHWSAMAENVGVGPNPEQVHDAFMTSATHRENIMDRSFRYVGVGSRVSNGRIWVTVIFETRNDPGTTLDMPGC